jgi:hypothetical protein
MTYAQALPWSVAFTKTGSQIIEWLFFPTREKAEAFAAPVNRYAGQSATVMTSERARWFRANQVYVN